MKSPQFFNQLVIILVTFAVVVGLLLFVSRNLAQPRAKDETLSTCVDFATCKNYEKIGFCAPNSCKTCNKGQYQCQTQKAPMMFPGLELLRGSSKR